MMNQYKKILSEAGEFVSEAYRSAQKDQFPYHNLTHTQNVLNHAFEIAAHYELPEKDIALLGIAAWFHDTGHLYTSPAGHEQKSVEVMKKFMEEHHESNALINEVADLIMATEVNHEPATLLQQVIRDADTYHFGTKDFKNTNKQVKKEYEIRGISTAGWEAQTLEILKKHKFFTSYCIGILNSGKEENMKKALKKMNKTKATGSANNLILKDMWDKDKKKFPNPNSFITKGIQTSLRLTSENHLKLSDMADGKANILITVNAIIISVILSVLLRKIEVEKHLAIPTFIFLAAAVVTIIVAIMATRPKVTQGRFSREDVLNKRTNLLFFGNFYRQTLEEYTWAMGTMLNDPDYLYGSLVEDIYFLGVVLGRKYKLLRIAYNLFMIGIIISVAAFTIAILMHKPSDPTIITTGGSPF
jgi:predicted metal-dependent HD superfamily phosphohydrolase